VRHGVKSLVFEKSLELKNVPYDWRTANITALLKKGDRSKPVNLFDIGAMQDNGAYYF
jgi:hypothetical protein